MECLLIADDLTGACDAAASFAAHGYRTAAALEPGRDISGVDVLSISTESRGMAAECLTQTMLECCRGLAGVDARLLFKKIDSTLRGNPGAEIVLAREALGCDVALVTPAFPAMGRIVDAGCLRISGQADDAAIELAPFFRSQGVRDCSHVDLAGLGVAIKRGDRFLSVEARCDEDLDQIVAAGVESGRRVLWAGSAGLASALARGLPVGKCRGAGERATATAVLLCMGSDHPITIEQQNHLLENRRAIVVSALSASGDCLAETLENGSHVILRIPRGHVSADRLRDLLGGIRELSAPVILSGGDTASLVYRSLAMQRILLEGEITAGIPHGSIIGGDLDGCLVATKSGGFGAPDALMEVADFFTCQNR